MTVEEKALIWARRQKGNVLKYIWRHGKKRSETNPDQLSNAIEDLEKAAWYLQNEIELLKEVREKL